MVKSHYGYDGVAVIDVRYDGNDSYEKQFIWAMTMMGFLRL